MLRIFYDYGLVGVLLMAAGGHVLPPCGTLFDEHVNFRNGAGPFMLCYVLHYVTVGHVHTNFPMGPIFYTMQWVYHGTVGHVHANFPVGPNLHMG